MSRYCIFDNLHAERCVGAVVPREVSDKSTLLCSAAIASIGWATNGTGTILSSAGFIEIDAQNPII